MKTESLKGAFIFILFSDALHNSPLKLPPIANDFRLFKLLYKFRNKYNMQKKSKNVKPIAGQFFTS